MRRTRPLVRILVTAMDNGLSNENGPEASAEPRKAEGEDTVMRRLVELGFRNSPGASGGETPSVRPSVGIGSEGYPESVRSDNESEDDRPRKRFRNQFEGLRVKPYAGKPEQDLVYWLINYQQAAASQGWNEARMKNRLSFYLTGDAGALCFHRRERKGTTDPSADLAELNWDDLS